MVEDFVGVQCEIVQDLTGVLWEMVHSVGALWNQCETAQECAGALLKVMRNFVLWEMMDDLVEALHFQTVQDFGVQAFVRNLVEAPWKQVEMGALWEMVEGFAAALWKEGEMV